MQEKMAAQQCSHDQHAEESPWEIHALQASSLHDLHASQASGSVTDRFSTIRRNCEQHMRRLERYKKARSFCSLQQQDACSSSGTQEVAAQLEASTELQGNHNGSNNKLRTSDSQFEELRAKMLTLMENDMCLLAKLLQLGETLRELRANACVREADADVEKDEAETEEEAEDECRPLQQGRMRQPRGNRRRAPLPPEFAGDSRVTRVYLGDADDDAEEARSLHPDEDDDDADELRPNVQYFSRKNSVLRIPIPPRASNRNFARPSKRNACVTRPVASEHPLSKRKTATATEEVDDSGHSSASEQTHSPQGASAPATVTSTSCCSSRFSTFSSSASCSSGHSSGSSGSGKKRAKSEERSRHM